MDAVRKEDKDLKAMLDEGLTRLMKSAKWNELKKIHSWWYYQIIYKE